MLVLEKQTATLLAAMRRGPHSTELRWLLADSQQKNGVLILVACNELDDANNHVSTEVDPSSVELQMRNQPWTTS